MSDAGFIRQYWKDSVNERLMNIEKCLTSGNRDESFVDDLDFVKFELNKFLAKRPSSTFKYADSFTPELVTMDVVQATRKFVEDTRKDCNAIYNTEDSKKQKIIEGFQAKDKEGFLKLKNSYFNDKLDDFVRNGSEMEKSIIYNNRLYQKMDPIMMDPEHKLIKAHFYSPNKLVFGLPVSTLVINVLILWFKTGLFYIALYFRLLKKLLDSGELLLGKVNKGGD